MYFHVVRCTPIPPSSVLSAPKIFVGTPPYLMYASIIWSCDDSDLLLCGTRLKCTTSAFGIGHEVALGSSPTDFTTCLDMYSNITGHSKGWSGKNCEDTLIFQLCDVYRYRHNLEQTRSAHLGRDMFLQNHPRHCTYTLHSLSVTAELHVSFVRPM